MTQLNSYLYNLHNHLKHRITVLNIYNYLSLNHKYKRINFIFNNNILILIIILIII